MKKMLSILLAILLMASLAACGSGGSGSSAANNTAADSSDSSAGTEIATETETSETEETTEVDLSSPDIIIEYGDADAIDDLASKAQNFEIAEGTVVKISGVFSTGVSTPAIQEPKGDGEYVGLSLYVDGDWEAPEDRSDIEVTGYFVAGDYFMQFHVSPENITVQ